MGDVDNYFNITYIAITNKNGIIDQLCPYFQLLSIWKAKNNFYKYDCLWHIGPIFLFLVSVTIINRIVVANFSNILEIFNTKLFYLRCFTFSTPLFLFLTVHHCIPQTYPSFGLISFVLSSFYFIKSSELILHKF